MISLLISSKQKKTRKGGYITIRISGHLVSSILVSFGIWLVTKSLISSLAFLAGGILIDMDHIIEYLSVMPARPNIRDFITTCYESKFERIYVVFHSYEFLLIAGVLLYICGAPVVWYYLWAGALLHLVFDHATNAVSPMAYFFMYRLLHGFRKEAFLQERAIKNRSKPGNR